MSKNIVILGAGFGGLRAAIVLSKELKRLSLLDKYEITLVDRYNYHTFTPLLYEIATTSKQIADYLHLKSLVTYPLKEILDPHVNCITDEVLHLDLLDNLVHLKNSKIKFDYLIIALGAETNHFNIPGLKEHSLSLKNFDQAIAIRDSLWFAVDKDKKLMRVVVAGGGSTGVELASEIKEWFCGEVENQALTCKIHVTLVEKAENILPGFDKQIIKAVQKRLSILGIEILTNTAITRVEEHKVYFENGKNTPFDVLIWSGGVKASSLTQKIPVRRKHGERIEILGELSCIPESPDLKITGKIYAIGDIACIIDPETQKPIPLVARAAISQGSIAARNIIREIKKEQRLSQSIEPEQYYPKSYPYIIPTGGKYAVAKIGPFILKGFIAWILKGLVELNYLTSIMPFGKALKIWLRGLKVFIQNDRLG
ncbi:NAD(P)/FAD-dependent oxidoreductase [Candidatus Jorgensenbacteria bacterium]|nr:NAD(P)/FAD-dependent oxidoreductase [Candidatus Jorgensenbacteria bacterium]